MKPKIKVNFLYYENPFDINKNFIFKLLQKNYDVIISDNPDYVFFSVYKENNKFLLKDGTSPYQTGGAKSKNILKEIYRNLLKITVVKSVMWWLRDKGIVRPYAQMLDVPGDFVKIFYTCESIVPDMNKCDWAFSLCADIDNQKHMRVPPPIFFEYNFDLIKRKPIKKTKFCNFIYNNHVPFRNRFFKQLSKYKHIDSPGKCMNNMPAIGSTDTNASRSSEKWEIEKIKFIKPYKFSIACENRIKDGYNTDRIIHAYLAGSIPIYLGDNMIHNDFNTKCFINCNNRKIKEIIEEIKELDTNDKLYNEMLNQPLYNPGFLDTERNKIEERLKEIFK